MVKTKDVKFAKRQRQFIWAALESFEDEDDNEESSDSTSSRTPRDRGGSSVIDNDETEKSESVSVQG